MKIGDFKFSSFKAVQVPKGWDRLFMSIISLENGKTIAKTSKAAVRSGTCQWTEILSESVWVSRNEASKEMEDCLFKLVVAMGSARSGILGEATVNLTSYITSTAIVPVSLPLKKFERISFDDLYGPLYNLYDDELKQKKNGPLYNLYDDELRKGLVAEPDYSLPMPLNCGQLSDAMKEELHMDICNFGEVKLVSDVALLCNSSRPSDRPSMEDALKLLSGWKTCGKE
ncbi:hypothetical protein CCACVL1_28777 [Corchorus capsularis]|uniref:C2 NT-type domain-containing protein n=1 Tax=Corchorus capsularis TaxID=210143 RepID=A0A1R3G5B5_COCAP|nr:hypothetical protein CCACVL1_28777 [Corchorus capsularis]